MVTWRRLSWLAAAALMVASGCAVPGGLPSQRVAGSFCKLTVKPEPGVDPHLAIAGIPKPHEGCSANRSDNYLVIVSQTEDRACAVPAGLSLVQASRVTAAEAFSILGACLPTVRPTAPISSSRGSYLWRFSDSLGNAAMNDVDFGLQTAIAASAAPFDNYVRSKEVICFEVHDGIDPQDYFRSIGALPKQPFDQTFDRGDCYSAMTARGLPGTMRIVGSADAEP